MVKTPKHERPEWLREPPSDAQKAAARTNVGTFLDARRAKRRPTSNYKDMLPDFINFLAGRNSQFKTVKREDITTGDTFSNAIYDCLRKRGEDWQAKRNHRRRAPPEVTSSESEAQEDNWATHHPPAGSAGKQSPAKSQAPRGRATPMKAPKNHEEDRSETEQEFSDEDRRAVKREEEEKQPPQGVSCVQQVKTRFNAFMDACQPGQPQSFTFEAKDGQGTYSAWLRYELPTAKQ